MTTKPTPREPTQEMLMACSGISFTQHKGDAAYAIWRAMWDAARTTAAPADDLVARLRAATHYPLFVREEAPAEIERLQTQLAAARAELVDVYSLLAKLSLAALAQEGK